VNNFSLTSIFHGIHLVCLNSIISSIAIHTIKATRHGRNFSVPFFNMPQGFADDPPL